MAVSRIRTLMCVLAVATAAGCASNSQYTSTAGGDVDLAVYPSAVLAGSEVQRLQQMSDANILGHIQSVDSLEVAAADTALRLSKADDVLNYAKLMHLAHTGDIKAVRDVAAQTGIIPTVDVTKLTASHIAAAMDSVGITRDMLVEQQYITSQILLHRHVLAELGVLQGVAQNQAVRDQIAMMTPVVRDHLARAHAIAVARGYETRP